MTKIIILTYYFPPGNFAGSYRIDSWVKYLKDSGYYPIVITRHWNNNEHDYTGISQETQKSVELHDGYKVIRVPFKGSTRDRLVSRFGSKSLSVGRIFSFFQLLLQNIFIYASPQRELYFEAKRVLHDEDDLKIVITSGKPFILFQYCFYLKKIFPRIKWIADYRDPWNSEEKMITWKTKWFRFVERKFEIKWLSNASGLTTVSEPVAKGILTLLNRAIPYSVVKNGFEPLTIGVDYEKTSCFKIGYIGSLYNEQKIELFLEGYSKFLKTRPDAKIQTVFFGLRSQPAQASRVLGAMLMNPKTISLTKKLPKEILLKKAAKCHALLICGIPERRGTYTAKFMDYLALNKPIILAPSDHDVLERAVTDTSTGPITNDANGLSEILANYYSEWERTGKVDFEPNLEAVEEYKSSNQVKRLVSFIDGF